MTHDAKDPNQVIKEAHLKHDGAFMEFETSVLKEWLDYNEHMNDAAYALALSAANEAFLDHANTGASYRAATGCTLYTVEAHIYYLAEVHSTDRLSARTEISELTNKKLKLATTLIRTDGKEAARGEFLYLHYNQELEKVIPFPVEVFTRLKSLESPGHQPDPS